MLRGIRRGGLIGGLVRPGLAPTCALPSLSTSVPSAPSAWFCWPGLAPAGEALFFASPKKSKQKKGDPQSGSLRCATGNLRCSTAEGVWLNSLRCASLKQRQPLSLLRLRSSAQPGRGSPKYQIQNPKYKQGHAMACPCGFRYSFLSSAVWYSCLHPLCMRRGAEVQADQGSRCLSEVKRSEFSETPPEPSTAGCP